MVLVGRVMSVFIIVIMFISVFMFFFGVFSFPIFDDDFFFFSSKINGFTMSQCGIKFLYVVAGNIGFSLGCEVSFDDIG